MSKRFHVAVVGATGAVGLELIRVLQCRNFPVSQITLLASPRSSGKIFPFRKGEVTVQVLDTSSFRGVDFAWFCAGSKISKHYAHIAAEAGAVVIDNSSAFRMDPAVPLVIPEINGEEAQHHRGIIANPNCTTTITLMGLYPLHRAFNVRRVFASSYQAVSGSGTRGISELHQQVRALLVRHKNVERRVYPYQIAFNVLPHVENFLDSGYTQEEVKMQSEGRRILHLPKFLASVTCVRVPVYRAHSVAVFAEFEKPVSLEVAVETLSRAPGLRLVDDMASHRYPTPLGVEGKEECEIGRLRLDSAMENGLAYWVCGDQLLKGAALNAVQIAELLI
ncbi:Aspartate-semialdehyde dehydrogenase [Candidatus Xiphinematobacter sp. Idaho Grape]|uniref:aspartate-semialdehyde dehydrogenase n=1 Tax=Candidatus Xiphinematobacter sp. Idaho Grape TaxID=1704307 RepID=UPI0007069816|nr:aspartate-semialdehyde dehydrogenase [Candidatus Xiphinematobacter sp. Idaho Grape]ALJ56351.1 Aspartate-semialdehyde dehydrogenase [Candidatus Xiphinematobacter sp. Idaho Grape]